MLKEQLRGIRNHNPGNIDRNHIKWEGMADDQSGDARFIVFKSAPHGIRALCRCLVTYTSKAGIEGVGGAGIDTVREVVSRWAPPTENNTEAYIKHVADRLGVKSDSHIDIRNRDVLANLAAAIIAHENGGYFYPDDVLQTGVDAALGLIKLAA